MTSSPAPPGAVRTVLEYPYTRTTGGVLGAFLTGIRDGRLLAGRVGGKTYVPPPEYDPVTGAAANPEFVEVGPGGTVTAWTWVRHPTAAHPFARPFAFALILLDGADTPFVHAIDAETPDRMTTGMRVTARFARERAGTITDFHFVPEPGTAREAHTDPSARPHPGTAPTTFGDAAGQSHSSSRTTGSPEPSTAAAGPGKPGEGEGPVTLTTHVISLEYEEALYPHRERFLAGLRRGEVVGQRSPVSGKVYVPGRGYDQLERVVMGEGDDVVVAAAGAVSSFTEITPVAYHGQKETEPYIRASILLDGSDSPVTGVDIRTIPLAEFRVGLRLRAVWRPEDERDLSGFDNRSTGGWEGVFASWEPTGEPDADVRALEEHAF
ncbi:OB-fold domain-containing protein [Actinocorallia sp. A-T 12471]|uniref:OB-fold domain-containing protein n=1 Tax=Actinocorallia sp. A-T 12471 TaxID=3089813 RepID=UPI0029CD8D3F|nr:OB-fold domain-containing protein [Actinocorallia sp. A-T 12471]MDX6740933.1 OB-fold domain-containing protein [Actinocorallia sp. A-T 12471]